MEYTLENEYLKLTVSSKGAEVISLVRKCDGEIIKSMYKTICLFLQIT